MTNEERMAAAALLISLFVAGAVGGAAFTRVVQARRGPEPPGRWGGRAPVGVCHPSSCPTRRGLPEASRPWP
jgi:hypothetical protein